MSKGMVFGQVQIYMQEGFRAHRNGWNGKGMFVFIVNDWIYTDGRQDNYQNLPFIAMKTADNKVVPWVASQTDILAEDWAVVK